MRNDHGFDEFMFNENYKEMFNVPPAHEDCPNNYESVSACPCIYAETCQLYKRVVSQKQQQPAT